jgi:predicted Zn-dependent protease
MSAFGADVKPFTDPDHDFASTKAEIRILDLAVLAHDELKSRGLLYDDEHVVDYVRRIASRVAPAFARAAPPLEVYVVRDALVNAFAFPTARIYINLGLMSVVESEAQLAAVIGHEIAHVVLRHSLRSAIDRKRKIIASHVGDLLLFGTGLIYLGTAASLASHSRGEEREADLVGLQYLVAGAYEPNAAPAVFDVFQTMTAGEGARGSIYASHPDNAERIAYLAEAIATDQTAPRPVTADLGDYATLRNRILEENVKIRLARQRFELTDRTLERARGYAGDPALVEYYFGEVRRGVADDPEAAAADRALMRDEPRQQKAFATDFAAARAENYARAVAHYQAALAARPGFALPYRGLGLVAHAEGRDRDALAALERYLASDDDLEDRRYVARIVKTIKGRQPQ